MRFQERELKSFAQPIATGMLREGGVYFAVNYIDEEMLIPTVQTLVFAGKNLEAGDEGRYYFQDVDSYRQGIRYHNTSAGREAVFSVGSEGQINHIFEYERALDELLKCSIRRAKEAE